MMPSAPSDTTAPGKISPSFACESVTTLPSAITASTPETAVARLPFRMPEPCVAVEHAPTTEICGNEARLCSAKPWLSRYGASCPYLTPAPTVTVCDFASIVISSKLASEIWLAVLSAMLLKEWRAPRALNLLQCLTTCCTSSSEDGE